MRLTHGNICYQDMKGIYITTFSFLESCTFNLGNDT